MTAARTVRGPAHWGMIEGLERDLTKVIEDFDRAMNVDTLCRTREIGECLFLTMVYSHLLCCRAGAFAWPAQIYRDKLSPGFPLYGRHPRFPPQTGRRLGDQSPGAGGEQYILDLWVARDRENVVSSFNLCDPSRGEPSCWRLFLPEG